MSNQNLADTLYTSIADVIQQARHQLRQVVNQQMVQAYWHIGRLIVEEEQRGRERAEYGKQQLETLARRLQDEFGKGFDATNLRKMRQFYLTFPIRDTLCLELSWSHYRCLMRIENARARQWYADEAAQQNWSVRALERQIGVLYYERLLASKDKVAVEQEAQQKTASLLEDPREFLRDPYILDFLNLQDKTYQDVGQMDMYVRMYEEQRRRADDNPTIGLILCSERNNTVAKYSVLSEGKQLFASRYLTELPSEEELERELERERDRVLRIQEAAARYQSDARQQDTGMTHAGRQDP